MMFEAFDRRQLSAIALGLILSLAAWLAVRPWDVHHWMIGAPLGRDFVNFWFAPRLVRAGQAGLLVDFKAYGAAVVATFHLEQDPGLLFSYPPHTLLFLAPLSCLPFLPAVLVWTGLNLVALARTVRIEGAAVGGPITFGHPEIVGKAA